MAHEYESSRGTRRSTAHAPKEGVLRFNAPAGAFAGWISREWGIAWVVSEARKDKRTGALSPVVIPQKVYLLQYEMREPGKHRARAKFQGIAAQDHIEAACKAVAFMEGIGLEPQRAEAASLYYNERKINLWIGQEENDASGK